MATTYPAVIVAAIRGAYVITWSFPTTLVSGDVGAPLDAFHLADKTVQCFGLASNANIVIEGSNHLSTTAAGSIATGPWFTLTDPQDASLTFTATARLEQILENPRFIRPRLAAAATPIVPISVVMTAESGRR